MGFKTGTICSKHEEIYKLADKIQDLVSKCKDDGENMERGLSDKKDRIEALEAEVESLKAELERAEKVIADYQEENKQLSAQLDAVEAGEAP